MAIVLICSLSKDMLPGRKRIAPPICAAAQTTSIHTAQTRHCLPLLDMGRIPGRLSRVRHLAGFYDLLSPPSDSPLALVTSAIEAIPALAGTQDTGFAWTVFTGDLVAHDPENEISR